MAKKPADQSGDGAKKPEEPKKPRTRKPKVYPNFDERRAEIEAIPMSDSAVAEFMTRNAVYASISIERYQLAYEAERERSKMRSKFAWQRDCVYESAKLFSKLHTDPPKISAMLQGTVGGCEHMVKHWNYLIGAVNANGSWKDPQRQIALDLLGVPTDRRKKPKLLIPPDGVNLTTHLLKLCRTEIDRLQQIRDIVLVPLEEIEREFAMEGDDFATSSDGKKIIRYMKQSWTTYNRSIRNLKEWVGLKKNWKPPVGTKPPAPQTEQPAADQQPLGYGPHARTPKTSQELFDYFGKQFEEQRKGMAELNEKWKARDQQKK